MTPKQLREGLKTWMKDHQKTTVDVASLTHVSPSTVKRFIDGDTDDPHTLTIMALSDLLEEAAAKKHETVS